MNERLKRLDIRSAMSWVFLSNKIFFETALNWLSPSQKSGTSTDLARSTKHRTGQPVSRFQAESLSPRELINLLFELEFAFLEFGDG